MTNLNLTEQMMRMIFLLGKERVRLWKDNDNSNAKDSCRKRLLGMIQAHPGKNEKDLIRLLGRRLSHPEEIIEGLVKDGYITVAAAGDGEDKTVVLTELGGKEAASMMPDPDRAFQVLNDEEKARMSGYLDRIIENLAADDGEEEDCSGFPGCGWRDGMFPGDADSSDFRGFGNAQRLRGVFGNREDFRGWF